MLRTDSFDRLVDLMIRAKSCPAPSPDAITSVLASDDTDGIARAEIWRLQQSLEIAIYAEGLDPSYAETAQVLMERFEGMTCVPLDDSDAWCRALAAASSIRTEFRRPKKASRARRVGEACERLKRQGRRISVGTWGPRWDERSLLDACSEIDVLVARLGGAQVFRQIGLFVKEQDRTFEGLWLFGERNLGITDLKFPSVPFGWLLALSAKHSHLPNRCRRPEVAWGTVIERSTDIAATFDCERYGQFEHLFLPLSELDRAIRDALNWRALFTSPQTPDLTLPYLRKAFADELTEAGDADFAEPLSRLWNEFDLLREHLSEHDLTLVTQADAERTLPTLMRHSRIDNGRANEGFVIPVGRSPRNDTRYVLLGSPDGELAARPTSMSVQAFCETIFAFLRQSLPLRASKIQGRVLERAIEAACRGKSESMLANYKYRADGNDLEMDVATRSGRDVTLIEVKGKSLTARAQVGDTALFLKDYAQSFLFMLKQLARHERHVLDRQTLLWNPSDAGEPQIERIAVSPVSYGPVGDRLLANAIYRAFIVGKIEAASEEKSQLEAVKAFNKELRDSLQEIGKVATNDKGELDIDRFFRFTRWLDLGQLLFALEHAGSVHEALRPVRYVTFQSRDFWTEIALATRHVSSAATE